ncbi:DUF4245 domain-containing protein [Actinokineospora iranica]|uniref:DUF4245 domain-containing protein n=1 Tax=Actinokineospora iranica TaxID=1271860 RepID=UPI0011145556|nr:DUF4245 domain-containing protein [Actinokineospora iranica]
MAQTPEPRAGRANHTLRDMVLSLLALLLILAPLVVFSRGCSFSPGPPDADPATAPTVDVAEHLGRAAASVDFPLRAPTVPDTWRANSSSTSRVRPVSVVVRAGWLTPDRFIQLSQSSAALEDLLPVETGQAAPAIGTMDVDGTVWTEFSGRRAEKAWAADLGGTTTLITGSATPDEFRVLASAAQAAGPLPKTTR